MFSLSICALGQLKVEPSNVYPLFSFISNEVSPILPTVLFAGASTSIPIPVSPTAYPSLKFTVHVVGYFSFVS